MKRTQSHLLHRLLFRQSDLQFVSLQNENCGKWMQLRILFSFVRVPVEEIVCNSLECDQRFCSIQTGLLLNFFLRADLHFKIAFEF